MVYGFAKQSGGHVEIESAEGEGTVVHLVLPSSEMRPEARQSDENADLHRGRGESILVVEDEASLRRVVVRHLEYLGYSVISAADGMEAVSVIKSTEPIDFLLSDLMLPGGISGRRVAEEMRRHRPEVKILLMSGYADETLKREDTPDSADTLLNKPFRRSELASKIRALLDE